jgi:hypothetical protein
MIDVPNSSTAAAQTSPKPEARSLKPEAFKLYTISMASP